MSHTNNTTFMNLPLFVGSDKPAWLTDFNSAMQAIDNTCSNQKSDIDALQLAMTAVQNAITNLHPIGSIYISTSSTSPAGIFGGTWARIQDTFLLAAGSTYAAGSTGGEAQHTLSIAEMPKHVHGIGYGANVATGNAQNPGSYGSTRTDTITSETGGGQPHNNMPPYLAVYVWQRTA